MLFFWWWMLPFVFILWHGSDLSLFPPISSPLLVFPTDLPPDSWCASAPQKKSNKEHQNASGGTRRLYCVEEEEGGGKRMKGKMANRAKEKFSIGVAVREMKAVQLAWKTAAVLLKTLMTLAKKKVESNTPLTAPGGVQGNSFLTAVWIKQEKWERDFRQPPGFHLPTSVGHVYPLSSAPNRRLQCSHRHCQVQFSHSSCDDGASPAGANRPSSLATCVLLVAVFTLNSPP